MEVVGPARPTAVRPQDLDPRTLDRLMRESPASGWVRSTYDAAKADPRHATSTLRRAARDARKLRSRERRTLWDVVYDCIRLDALATDLGLHPLDLWLEDRDLGASPFHLRAGCSEAIAEDLLQTYGEGREDWLRASNTRADAHLRVNTTRISREILQRRLAEADITTEPIGERGLRVEGRANLQGHRAYLDGLFELQDLASQQVAGLVGEGRVLDYCAGAGGKSLAMAAAGAKVTAWDVRRRPLDELRRRAKRARTPIEVLVAPPQGEWDTVLVDAPCSGSGVWRRHPEFRWRLDGLDDVITLQRQILEEAARCVRPGGRLIYATCSVLQGENEAHGGEVLLRTTPTEGADGMYAALH